MTTLSTLIKQKEKELRKIYPKKILSVGNYRKGHTVDLIDFLSQSIQAGYELGIKDMLGLECMKDEPDDLDAFARDSELAGENLNRNELRETLKLQLQSLLKKEKK